MENYFSYLSTKTYVVGTQKNHLGYSKEPSQWDGSFEHPKHMSNLMGKNNYNFMLKKILILSLYFLHFRWMQVLWHMPKHSCPRRRLANTQLIGLSPWKMSSGAFWLVCFYQGWFFKPMEISIKLHAINSGWSIVYIEGPQILIFKIYCISFSEDLILS